MKKEDDKYMAAATVGEKGQIVIPKKVREMMDIKPGDTLILLVDKKKGIGIPPKNSVADIIGAIMNKEESQDE
ncbi:MAG: AbrB/MazE/SpoVT family DNA-binding domain-containing protein [Lachnospiraceae bacterium]|jgi:AbrB family looped-hinge helix DNA binding protein|nr:AbrB/MazE/SpoVT family DNA-binding domain-containing protein [Lachnospiraceae bacterium]